jgi:hypothetical protein
MKEKVEKEVNAYKTKDRAAIVKAEVAKARADAEKELRETIKK